MEPIAHIHTDFTSKFGVPRQAGLVRELRATIVFAPEYRNPEALRGLDGFSHLWLIWEFSQCVGKPWSPTVRPPRLGGNARMGVFATRSPFRPNPIGLSCVELVGVEEHTIKPYVPYADCHPEAVGGFAQDAPEQTLKVEIPPHLLCLIPEGKREALAGVLAQDPRPPYQRDSQRVYGFGFGGLEVHFTVDNGVARVVDIHG